MNRKAIAILGAIFVLIVGTLSFLIIQKRKSSSPADNTNTQTNTTVNTNTTVVDNSNGNSNDNGTFTTTNKAVKISDDHVVSPILFYQGNGITYFNQSGQLFQSDIQTANGKILLANKRELTIPLKINIKRILWPSAGNNFAAEFDNGGRKTWSVYSGDSGVYKDLPSSITSFQWLPGGDTIMYLWLGADNKTTLSMANPDATGFQTLAQIRENDDEIYVSPDGKSVLFHRKQTADANNKIVFVTADGKLFKTAVEGGYNYGVLWAPDSKHFLFGKRNATSQDFDLYVGDITTGQSKSLGVTSITEKAVWSTDSTTVYVGLPRKGSPQSGLTEDVLTKITIDTVEKKDIEPGLAVDIRDLFLSLDGKTLFFKNLQDLGLYYMDVSK